MTDAEKLKALALYAESLRASIEILEIKADFFESILPEIDPEFAVRYQYYLHDRLKERQANPKSAIGFLLPDCE